MLLCHGALSSALEQESDARCLIKLRVVIALRWMVMTRSRGLAAAVVHAALVGSPLTSVLRGVVGWGVATNPSVHLRPRTMAAVEEPGRTPAAQLLDGQLAATQQAECYYGSLGRKMTPLTTRSFSQSRRAS